MIGLWTQLAPLQYICLYIYIYYICYICICMCVCSIKIVHWHKEVIFNRNGVIWTHTYTYFCYFKRSSNGSIFRVTGLLCGEFTGHRWIPRTKASDAELWCFLDLRLNKRLSKQWWGWWFETPSRPLWRHCNEEKHIYTKDRSVINLPWPCSIESGCQDNPD